MCTCPLRSSAFCSVRWCSLPSRTRTLAFRSHSEQMVVSSTCTVCVQRQKSHWLLFVTCCMPMTALLSPIVSMIYNNWRTPSQLPPRGLGWRSVSRKQRCCFNLQEDPQPVHLRSRLTARSWTVLIPSHTLEAACRPPTPLTRKYLPVLQRQVPPMVGCRSKFGVTGGWA